LVAPKAGAQHEHEILFNKLALEVSLLNKSSGLAQAFGVTKFKMVKGMILVTVCCAP
jgi:hypothetical protein